MEFPGSDCYLDARIASSSVLQFGATACATRDMRYLGTEIWELQIPECSSSPALDGRKLYRFSNRDVALVRILRLNIRFDPSQTCFVLATITIYTIFSAGGQERKLSKMRFIAQHKFGVVLALFAAFLPRTVMAEACSVPQGYVTLVIEAGTGSAARSSFISLPLLSQPTGVGRLAGIISSLTSNTISNSSGAWNAGSFAVAGNPFFVRFTSGTAIGRIFLITGNSTNSLTLDTSGIDLLQLGIVSGIDTYEIFPGDTIISIFGTPSPSNPLVGGTSTSEAVDKLYLRENGAWVTYFYNTAAAQWRRGSLPISQNNKILHPSLPFLFSRIGATPLSFKLTGRVPDTSHAVSVLNNGDSGIATYFPIDQTLGSLSLQSLTGWKKAGNAGITASNADKIYLLEHGAWVTYHYDVTVSQWRRGTLPISQNNKILMLGSGFLVQWTGTTGSATYTMELPYSLD